MRQFAEQTIILPDGPHKDEPFNCDIQPYSRLWFDAVDSELWQRIISTGPTQSGKSLTCFVIPALYHLFERRETVICGIPSMDIAHDKWQEDFLPTLEACALKDQLPTSGPGSRGGNFESIRFRNGVTLKFMSGGGDDKKRAAFTSRVVVITETDGMDEPGNASREADKITQIEARTRAYGARKRIYMECTVSIEKGRTWQEYNAGTRSQIVLPCPRCGEFVTPEREHFRGWKGAANELEAGRLGHFVCPACDQPWTDVERVEANKHARLIHRGQTIDTDGNVSGELPATNTLGFRWSAVNNLFADSNLIGSEEWKASQADDEENAEKERLQFAWAKPHAPSKLDSVELDVRSICARVVSPAKGRVPVTLNGTPRQALTLGIDVGKHICHWTLIAWFPGASAHVSDYGTFEVPSSSLGIETGIQVALREFRDGAVLSGWPDERGALVKPDTVWVDSGWQKAPVYAFCHESGARFRPAKGFGAGADKPGRYSKPRSLNDAILWIGDGCHIKHFPAERTKLVEIDVDQWKSWLHRRLTVPVGSSGSMVLAAPTAPAGTAAAAETHLRFARHLTAEKETEEFVIGKGVVMRWEHTGGRENHYFDSTMLACAAGNFCKVKLIDRKPATASVKPAAPAPVLTTPDGRPFLITERGD